MSETPRTEPFRITVTERCDDPLGGWTCDGKQTCDNGDPSVGVTVPRSGMTEAERTNALSPLDD